MREFCCVVEEGKKGLTCLRLIYCNNHVLIRLKAERHKTHIEIAGIITVRKKKVVWLQTRLALAMLTIMWVSTI